MSITLYEHNENAYHAALTMLRSTGKAAVIHPTGTGKSFIGFKFCEDFPEKNICWLSPSEYIFRTQLDNLAAESGLVPENITFLTYARLMTMDEEEIAAIQPDLIILDEFHRCGAEQWGKGVQTLLNAYPDAPLLGLSATNIRFLDNQRDMADELFDGHIASEMTLGEAIARNILKPPKYILSVYSFQKDLERYEVRVAKLRDPVRRDRAMDLLKTLRRNLEESDGLDAVFARHMPDRNGRYIVFCSSMAHMNRMISYVPEWFSSVDPNPHIYRAYSPDPATQAEFEKFRTDESDHLKLLFTIDMLNEGIHVTDVDGVILFRPTVSPIIYKQQIGRALSAGSEKTPVIFDVVNNIENLTSIGALERDFEDAVLRTGGTEQERRELLQRFQIIDEVRDCRQLFERLNDALAVSWEDMYQYAKSY
ncbi:DEAD/DEAH box helicase family protein, partial [uncultured Mailhella sp.]|uniref:DEAD/DEAH box helicase n=1 Tax=uncultured Mailhella sp. TaxID=1981031 RepID=UPI002618DC78